MWLPYPIPMTESGVATKGFITERIDDRRNRTDYDNREVLFLRYQKEFIPPNAMQIHAYSPNLMPIGSTITGVNSGATAIVYNQTIDEWGGWGTFIYVTNVVGTFQYWEPLTNDVDIVTTTFYTITPVVPIFNSYKDTGFGSVEQLTFSTDVESINNYIGNFTQFYFMDWGMPFLLSNNVFGSSTFANRTGVFFMNNTFGYYNTTNTFGNFNTNNTFGNYNSSNIFGDNNSYNTFGDNNSYNTFGNSNYSNTFGDGNYSNTFGNYNNFNPFGNDNSSNTFGNGNSSNTFVNNNNRNTFLNNNGGNTFGNGNNNNSFVNGNRYNTFGDGNLRNIFGNGNGYNSFVNYNQNNTFGWGNWQNTFGTGNSGNTFGNNNNSNTFENDNSSITFGNYNYYNTFVNNNYSNSFGDGNSSNNFVNNNYSNNFGDSNSSNTFGNNCRQNSFTNLITGLNFTPITMITNGPLIIGVEYTITNYMPFDDFTNVGAVNNQTWEVFTATGDTPTDYSNGSDLTHQSTHIRLPYDCEIKVVVGGVFRLFYYDSSFNLINDNPIN